MTWQDDILQDAIPWFESIAFFDGAFKDFETPSKLRNQKVPAGVAVLQIKWKDEFKNCPIFRQSPSSREPITQSQFRTIWNPLLQQTGYTVPVTIHRIRQGVCNALDG
jgi:hypothetical protein